MATPLWGTTVAAFRADDPLGVLAGRASVTRHDFLFVCFFPSPPRKGRLLTLRTLVLGMLPNLGERICRLTCRESFFSLFFLLFFLSFFLFSLSFFSLSPSLFLLCYLKPSPVFSKFNFTNCSIPVWSILGTYGELSITLYGQIWSKWLFIALMCIFSCRPDQRIDCG